jgi:hypothetical protein
MNNDVFQYSIYITGFSNLLLWLMLICFSGACLTGGLMMVISRFFLDKDGRKFSIMAFELPLSFNKFKTLTGNISIATKDTVRMNLRLDYFFMPFAYLFLLFTGWYLLHRFNCRITVCAYYYILFVPFTAWLFDILENLMAFACLTELTKTKAVLLFIFSLLKWILIIGYLLFLLALVTGIISCA